MRAARAEHERTTATIATAFPASHPPFGATLSECPLQIHVLPYLPVLLTSIQNAVPRPVTPFYPAVTQAIQQNSFAAISGDKSVDQAMTDMQAAISAAVGFA